jgi:hypothetical protein
MTGTLSRRSAPLPDAPPVQATGVASLAIRDLLRGPRRAGHVLAVLPQTIYLAFPDSVPEPRVIALSHPDAIRLPNSILTSRVPPVESGVTAQAADRARIEQGGRENGRGASAAERAATERAAFAEAGEGHVTACGLDVRIVRWWDPSPVFGPLSRARLDHGAGVLAKHLQAAGHQVGLIGHPAPVDLANSCAAGDLGSAVEAAELLTGLGPGLVPSGDGIVCGILLALRLLGGAISGGMRAVWLADWLGAAATDYAEQRTTPLAAALLYCAASGQAAAEVSAVLLGMAGLEPLEPAASKLLTGTAGADLAWGLVAGCRAALMLSVS